MAEQKRDLIDILPVGPAARTSAQNTSPVVGSAEHVAPETLPQADRQHPAAGECADLPDLRLADYKILSRLGSRPHGDTYLAYERALVRHVEVTVLRRELAADPFFVRQFRTEIGAVACLNHPNLLPIFLIQEDQGTVLYVTQHVDGETLANLMVRAEPPVLDDCLSIMEQVLSAVAAAERRKLLDCEIRAEHILLQLNSHPPRVLDIGLVGAVACELCRSSEIGDGPAIGRGGAAQPGTFPQALHSLGVLLQQMLRYRGLDDGPGSDGPIPALPAPPLAPTLTLEADQCRKEWRALPGFEAIAAVADRMAAQSPGGSCASVDEAYRAFCAARQELLRRQVLPIRGSQVIPGMVSGGLEAAVLEAAVPLEKAVERSETLPRRTDRGHRTALRIGFGGLAGALLIFSLMGGWGESDPTRALRGGHTRGSAGWFAEAYRNWSVAGVWSDPGPAMFITRVATQPEWEIPWDQHDHGPSGVSREFNLLTLSGSAGELVTWDTSAREARTSLSLPVTGGAPLLCSPDGRYVAAVTSSKEGQAAQRLEVWDVRQMSGPVAAILAPAQSKVIPLAFAQDATAMVALIGEPLRQRLVCWKIASWEEIGSLPVSAASTRVRAVHPDGLQVAFGNLTAGMIVHDLSNGSSASVPQHLAAEVESLAFHPRSPELAIGTAGGAIHLWDLEQQRVVAEYQAGSGPVRALAFDRPGRRLASASDENVRVWDLSLDYVRLLIGAKGIRSLAFDSTGRELVTGGPARSTQIWNTDFDVFEVNFPAWVNILESSPQGIHRTELAAKLPTLSASAVRSAVTPDGHLAVDTPPDTIPYVRDATTGVRLGELSGAKPAICAAVTPDGRFAATGTFDSDRQAGLIQVWDLHTRTELRRMWTDTRHVMTLAYTADGRRLLSGGERKVHVWSAETGQEICRLPFPSRCDGAILLSPNGRQCVARTRGPVDDSPAWCVLYDLIAEVEVLRYPGAPAEFAFAPREFLCDQRFGRGRQFTASSLSSAASQATVSALSETKTAVAP